MFSDWTHPLVVGLCALFLLTASAHFIEPRRTGLVAIVPPRLPQPDLLVTMTGVLELAGAVGLLIPATRRPDAACLALLLVAMFPANVYAAAAPRRPASPTTPLVPRLGMQICFALATVAVAFA